MKTTFLAVVVMLSGCADWSPEKQAAFENALQTMQNNSQAQRQPPMQMMVPRPTNCRTVLIGNGYNTVCN